MDVYNCVVVGSEVVCLLCHGDGHGPTLVWFFLIWFGSLNGQMTTLR